MTFHVASVEALPHFSLPANRLSRKYNTLAPISSGNIPFCRCAHRATNRVSLDRRRTGVQASRLTRMGTQQAEATTLSDGGLHESRLPARSCFAIERRDAAHPTDQQERKK